MNKKLLVIIDKTPNSGEVLGNLKFKETIDAALGVAAFGVEVSLWFCGNGVNCLQKPEQFKIIEALSYYDIENVYVALNDCSDLQGFATKVTQIDDQQLSVIVSQQDTILRMN